MNVRCDEVQALLPFLASGTLEEGPRQGVEEHLASCADCRAELALWTAVGRQVVAEDRSLPAPGPGVLSGALERARAGNRRRPRLSRVWQLLCAQTQLIRREVWLASAIVIGMGSLLSLGLEGREADLLIVLAPLVTAAGIAMIYGPENDPALELALATPTSPRQVLLARMFLVFGYNLVWALAATLVISVTGGPDLALGDLVLGWLAPMTSLSALALVLSLWIGGGNAATLAFVAWTCRWLVRGFVTGLVPWQGGESLMAAAAAVDALAGSLAVQVGLAAALLALSLWLVARPSVAIRTALS